MCPRARTCILKYIFIDVIVVVVVVVIVVSRGGGGGDGARASAPACVCVCVCYAAFCVGDTCSRKVIFSSRLYHESRKHGV